MGFYKYELIYLFKSSLDVILSESFLSEYLVVVVTKVKSLGCRLVAVWLHGSHLSGN